MNVLSKGIYRFSVICIKLPTVVFTELEQIISQFVWKHKKFLIAKAIEKEEWNWKNQPPDFRLYYKVTVINTEDTDTKTET